MDPESKIYWKTPLTTLAQILDAFDNLPDDVELPTDIFLEPPELNIDTDEDSGDEDEPNPNNFTTNQLNACVELRYNSDDLSNNECEEIISASACEEISTSQRINQKWGQGSEENFRLSALLYKFKSWNGKFMCPLTLSEESNAIDFFQLYITPSFVDLVVNQTTIYAAKQRNKTINIDADDVYAFLGVMILSGYNVLLRRRLYWANDEDTRNELVSKWMRRNLFEDIFTNIHFCDVDSIGQTTDRFAKIRPFIIHLNDVFLKYAPVEMNIAVDESMIPYYGRHPCKQFIRNKPVRFGYKAWVAAGRLGYCYQFDLYQGRNQQRPNNFGLGESVVLSFAYKLQNNFPGIPFAFYFDNFFTGPNLICALNKMKFVGTGTLRVNRLKNIKTTDKKILNKKPRGYFENHVDQENELILTQWKDNQTVSLLSNYFGKYPVGTARRYVHSEQKRVDIPQPAVVKMYNRNMGGVDILDNHISNYRMNIRGKKFYMPVVLWMFDLAVTNAWTLAKSYNMKMDQLEFRRQLARSLLIRYGKLASRGKTAKTSQFLAKGPHTTVKTKSRLRCRQCHSQTIYACSTCNIALHSKCSGEFHRQLT